MIRVDDHLYIGDQVECSFLGDPRPFVAVVHAAKWPCHAQAVGYDGKTKIHPSHPEYLWAERPGHVFLNIIDPKEPLFRVEVFTKALDFLDEWTPKGSVLCHCNNGLSRAPSIAMLWMAKRAKAFLGSSYPEAKAAFTRIMGGYTPGKGIEAFLEEKWDKIG